MKIVLIILVLVIFALFAGCINSTQPSPEILKSDKIIPEPVPVSTPVPEITISIPDNTPVRTPEITNLPEPGIPQTPVETPVIKPVPTESPGLTTVPAVATLEATVVLPPH